LEFLFSDSQDPITYIHGIPPDGRILDTKRHPVTQLHCPSLVLRLDAHIRCTSRCNTGDLPQDHVTVPVRMGYW